MNMLLNRPSIFTGLTICLLVSISACANTPASKTLEQTFAADPQLENNPPFRQLTENRIQNNQNNQKLVQPETVEKPVQLPANLASEIPPYPNSQLLKESPEGQQKIWSSSDPTNVVQNFYQKEFQDKNWEIISYPPEEGNGSLVAEKNNLQVKVSLKPSSTPGIATEYQIEYHSKNEAATNVLPPAAISTSPATPLPEIQPSTPPLPNSTPSPTSLLTTPLPSPGLPPLLPSKPFPPSSILPPPTPITPESPILKKALKDVPSGLRSYISDLSKLGVFEQEKPKNQNNPDATTPLSEPQNIVTRRVYVRWLVNANNEIFANNPAKQIRLAGANDTPIFEDVPKTDPDFTVIQGLAEAGLIPSPLSGNTSVVKFRPDEPLTREVLILWKVPLDIRKTLPAATLQQVKQVWDFQDTSKIAPAALKAVFADSQNGDFSNIRRVFGYTRLFRPGKTVSRAEAAAALWYFGTEKNGMSAQTALQAKRQS